MATISSTDNLYATASMMGRQIFDYNGAGVESFGDLVALVRNGAGTLRGLVTMTVRNASQGWMQSRSFYLG